MPTIPADALQQFVRTLFHRAGCKPPEDEQIARRLVGANLAGHDSHGVIRVPDYIRWLEHGMVRANRTLQVVGDTGPLLVMDGQQGFGQSIGEQAMQCGIERCRVQGVAIVALRNCGHLGRIGDWPELVAEAGLVSLHLVNTSGFGLLVAPYGGIERRLSANPFAAGVPVAGRPPIVLDISTCAIAEGKIKVARNRGTGIPPGCIIDAEGRPTEDPLQFYSDPPGAILPFGGHKGYGLSVICELLAGAFTGSGCTNPENCDHLINGMLSILLDPHRVPSSLGFDAEVQRFIHWVKSARRVAPDGEILMPGEMEDRIRQQRLQTGIELDDTTWKQLADVANRVGVAMPEPSGTI